MSQVALKEVQISEVVVKADTWNPARDAASDQIHYIDLSSVDNVAKVVTGFQTLAGRDAPSRARQLVKAGDILVSTVRPNLNGVAKVPQELDGATASTGFCILRPRSEKIDTSFLFHWVQSPNFVADMERKATGASYPAVSDKIIFQSGIPLPPLQEQKRIAATLDQADELRRKRQRAIERINQLGQAIFHEMFGAFDDAELNQVRLGELTTKIGSGATPKGGDAAYKTSGTPLIRSMNVRDGEFAEKGLAYIDDEQAAKLNNVIVRANDVLLNITGASVARVCLAPRDLDGARVNQHVSIIRPNDRIQSEFLEAYLLMPAIKTKLLTIAESGATRQAITKSQIEELAVPIPSKDDQALFAERLRLVRSQLSSMLAQKRRLDDCFASLQDYAFCGEL